MDETTKRTKYTKGCGSETHPIRVHRRNLRSKIELNHEEHEEHKEGIAEGFAAFVNFAVKK